MQASIGSGLDPVIHMPARLRICALLSGVDRMSFARVRDDVDISKSALSKHVKVLHEIGYLDVVKEPQDQQGSRMWLELTDAGRSALGRHLGALEQIVRAAGNGA